MKLLNLLQIQTQVSVPHTTCSVSLAHLVALLRASNHCNMIEQFIIHYCLKDLYPLATYCGPSCLVGGLPSPISLLLVGHTT
jgi:hypothetical protein